MATRRPRFPKPLGISWAKRVLRWPSSTSRSRNWLARVPSLNAPRLAPRCGATWPASSATIEALEGHVHDLLAPLMPKGLGKRGRRVAVAVVALPYHGTVDEAHQDAGCRSKAQGGTPPLFPLPRPLPWFEGDAIPWRCVVCAPSSAWLTCSGPC